jgi:hypothetical protein
MKTNSKKKTEEDFKLSLTGEGLRLYELYQWSDCTTQEEFAQRIQKKRHWFIAEVKQERIGLDSQYALCRAFGIPKEYWEGKYELPILLPTQPTNQVNEQSPNYQTGISLAEQERTALMLENKKLTTAVMDHQNTIIQLQKEILELKEIVIYSNKNK